MDKDVITLSSPIIISLNVFLIYSDKNTMIYQSLYTFIYLRTGNLQICVLLLELHTLLLIIGNWKKPESKHCSLKVMYLAFVNLTTIQLDMFSTKGQLIKKTGPEGVGRYDFLKQLVEEFRKTKSFRKQLFEKVFCITIDFEYRLFNLSAITNSFFVSRSKT